MKSKVILPALLFAAGILAGGCGGPGSATPATTTGPDTGTWSITVEVVGETPREFTSADAAKIGPKEIRAAQKDGDNMLEEQVWTGILLDDLLKYVGVDGFSVIQVAAADGFSQEFDPSRIAEGATGLGWAVNGQKLDAKSGPVQLIAHARGPKWWVKQVSRVTIVK
jgi:hypothetical protein